MVSAVVVRTPVPCTVEAVMVGAVEAVMVGAVEAVMVGAVEAVMVGAVEAVMVLAPCGSDVDPFKEWESVQLLTELFRGQVTKHKFFVSYSTIDIII